MTRLAPVAVAVLAASPIGLAAESFQPSSHVTRGVYAHIHGMLGSGVWRPWSEGFEFVDQGAHGGASCIRCEGRPGRAGQGVGQEIEFNQRRARPIRIAGWSRCENVPGKPSYRYSVYVDFRLADNTSWPMKIAAFETGTHGWQYAETTVTPPKPVRSARVHVFVRGTSGTAYFDDLFVGEADGENLLRNPGFEKADRIDLSRREQLFDDLRKLNANAIHGYLGGRLKCWDEAPTPENEAVQFLAHAHQRGIGVWLTTHVAYGKPIRNASDPSFPQYFCVNGPWGRRWTETLAKIARFPFAGLSMTPDEFVWSTGRLKRQYGKHADAKVRDYYANLPAYCECPVCQRLFRAKYGKALPADAGRVIQTVGREHRDWLRFRYDSTTAWLKRTCAAVKKANPGIRTDSLICVTPLCSDRWALPGIAWDRAGYEAGLEYPTTDPYIVLHNYLGDSTHWYVTETTEHLAAAGPERRCGIVLEGSRLRATQRELDPVEIYGAALTAVWHGADELAWFHLNCIMGRSQVTERAPLSQACVSGVYGLLAKIDPWLEDVTPQPGVALLFSRASCDIWRLHLAAKQPNPPFDTRGVTDPRHASIAQKEALYLLLRAGVPTTLYYLDSVRAEELARHRVILVPFGLAVSRERAKLLEQLARAGKRVVIVGHDGPVDPWGEPHRTPVLRDLNAGAGKIVRVDGAVLDRLPASRDNETRKGKPMPTILNPEAARTLLAAVTDTSASPKIEPLLAGRLPKGDDVEVSVTINGRGERLLLAINWDSRARSVRLPKGRGFDRPAAEAYTLGADGRWKPWTGRLDRMQLAARQAIVARLARP